MNSEGTMDSAALARHERFGKLPERIHYEDMVSEKVTTPGNGESDRYNPEDSWNYYSCLAVDLGL